MLEAYLKENPLIVLFVAVIVLYFICSFKSEYMDNMSTMLDPTYNPNLFQGGIAQQAAHDKFIQMNQIVEPPWTNNVGKLGAKYGEIDGLSPLDVGLNYNLCSKSCCSQQWPVPFALKPDDLISASGEEFVPSTYTCNNGWQDTGCMCMTKKQSLFLNNRGGNVANE